MIFYSHINEDNSVEQAIMDRQQFDTLVAVCGSGERVISLLSHKDLKKVYVVDNNIEALHLLELKIGTLISLTVDEYLTFIGGNNSDTESLEIYERVKSALSNSSRQYWDDNKHLIVKGILNIGHLEIYLRRMRPLIRFILGNDFLKLLKHPNHNINKWSSWKWQFLKKFFNLKQMYKWMGMKDPAFLGEGADLSLITSALQTSMDNSNLHQSCMAHLIFFGHTNYMSDTDKPPSLCKQVLEKIKLRLEDVQLDIQYLHKDLLEAAVIFHDHTSKAVFYSLSDIMSFEDHDYLKKLILNIHKNQDHYSIIIRAFVRNRIHKAYLSELKNDGPEVVDLSHHEKTNMYQVINLKSYAS